MRLLFLIGILLFSFSLSSFSTANAHKFYVSTTTMEQDQSGTRLNISMLLFTDDLEVALGDEEHSYFHMGEEDESEDADNALEEYLRKKFIVEFDANLSNWSYIGKEVELETTWVYLELTLPAGYNVLEVRNDVFMEQFEDQINIVKVDLGGKEVTLHLNKFRKSDIVSY